MPKKMTKDQFKDALYALRGQIGAVLNGEERARELLGPLQLCAGFLRDALAGEGITPPEPEPEPEPEDEDESSGEMTV